MFDVLTDWYRRHFSDPQVVILALVLALSLIGILVLGDILTPVLVAVLLAYLLEGVVSAMERVNVPRSIGSAIVLLFFFIFFLFLVFGLVPLLWRQLAELIREFPEMIAAGQDALQQLPAAYPSVISAEQINEIITTVRSGVGSAGQAFLSFSLANAVNIFAFALYLVLVPLMVYFALKDKHLLMAWGATFAPRQRELIDRVWHEVDIKIASYIRGKFIEILIIWAVSFVTFALMGLDFALLLSFLVGVSVIIPFVGAVAVTIPVALIAFFQWGLEPQFGYLLLAYLVIQILDGNLLVPLLFSEVVNLHPVAIVVAVLFFGGLWGVWGVFFAIPLATLIQAVLNAWPREGQILEVREG
ncbi:MAG: AI-2E family transporter [Pseudomonadota bacterium]